MKKIFSVAISASILILLSGCELKFWPSENEADAPSQKESFDRNLETAPEITKPESERTTGKIYASGPEGIRPDNATAPRIRHREIDPGTLSTSVFRSSRSTTSLASNSTYAYWYECDYFGDCWDSEDYTWYDCYYNAYAPDCEEGNYWLGEDFWFECDNTGNCKDSTGFEWYDPSKDASAEPINTSACCDSWGNCYDENERWVADQIYLVTDFCDECGNCYDYYGNYTEYNDSYYDESICGQYYYYDLVTEWDICGNAYDKDGNFLFYDNYYYDYQACNNNYSACETVSTGEALNCDGAGNCYDTTGAWYADPFYLVSNFCDECGNCYDYYGNYTEYDESYIDDYWCTQYYQYDKVDSYDACGNAYDKYGVYLFYANEQYDYKACYGLK